MAIAVETTHIDDSGGLTSGLSLSITTPAANELIVVMVGLDRSDRFCTAIQDQNGDNFTIIEEFTNAATGGIGEQGGHFAVKVADGDETSVNLTMNTNNKHGAAAIIISGCTASVTPEAQAEDVTNISTAGTTITSPAVSNTTADAIAVAGFAGEQGNYWNGTTPSYSNSWQYGDLPLTTSGDGAGWLAYKIVSSPASQQTTYTSDDTGSNRYSAAAIFPIAGGGGGGFQTAWAIGATQTMVNGNIQ